MEQIGNYIFFLPIIIALGSFVAGIIIYAKRINSTEYPDIDPEEEEPKDDKHGRGNLPALPS